MRVGGPTQTGKTTAGRARKGAGAGGERFALEAPGTGTKAANASAPQAAAPVDALLALQGIDDPLFARKKSMRRGHALLDALEAIKADLLLGRVSEGRLNRIVALVGQAREATDPALTRIIDEIELRARVELAKFGVY